MRISFYKARNAGITFTYVEKYFVYILQQYLLKLHRMSEFILNVD